MNRSPRSFITVTRIICPLSSAKKYFFLAATFIIGRGTEILFMFQKEDGTFAPFYLARNMLDFMGPEGFPGPTSTAYTDQLGQTTRRVVFSPITTSAGVAWV